MVRLIHTTKVEFESCPLHLHLSPIHRFMQLIRHMGKKKSENIHHTNRATKSHSHSIPVHL